MNVWGRSLRLHIPLKDIFDALFAPILNNAISRREVILTSRHLNLIGIWIIRERS